MANAAARYDSADRLTGVTRSGDNQSFTIDRAGNRTAHTRAASGWTTTLSSTSNRMASTSSSTSRSYGYDGLNRLASVTNAGATSTYTSNALNQRVRKVTPAGTTYYIHGPDGELLDEHNANPTAYVWLDGELLGMVGGVGMQSYPGPQAGGIEHARWGPGQNYHVHLFDKEGREARMSAETWKPLTPEDAKVYNQSKQMQRAFESLTEGEKKFLDRVNRNVFHRGGPSVNQLIRLGGWRGRGGPRQPGD